jgi:hypothetical protein
VISTGTTAAQLIPRIAEEVGHLFVFHRSLNNSAIDPDTQKEIKANYGKVFAKCHDTFASFI